MQAWPSRPRCHGLTVAQPAISPSATSSSAGAASRQIPANPRPAPGRTRSSGWWLGVRTGGLGARRMAALWQSPGAGQGRLAALSLLVGLGLSACVGSGDGVPNPDNDPGNEPRTYAEIQAAIFDPMCAASCHRGGAAPKGLSLEANKAIKQLVGVGSVEAPGLMRVAPGQPELSYLVIKVVSMDPRRVGSRMPRNGPPWVSSAQVRALRRWIRDGATANWEASDEQDVLMVPFDAARAGDAGSMEPLDAGPSVDAGNAAEVSGLADAVSPDAAMTVDGQTALDAVLEDGW